MGCRNERCHLDLQSRHHDYDGPSGRNYYAGTIYTAELYTNSSPQELAEFLDSVGNTSGGATCAGFVSISWRLPSFDSLP